MSAAVSDFVVFVVVVTVCDVESLGGDVAEDIDTVVEESVSGTALFELSIGVVVSD